MVQWLLNQSVNSQIHLQIHIKIECQVSDRTLNEVSDPVITSTCGSLHIEFLCLLFSQTHRETVTSFLHLQEFSHRNPPSTSVVCRSHPSHTQNSCLLTETRVSMCVVCNHVLQDIFFPRFFYFFWKNLKKYD